MTPDPMPVPGRRRLILAGGTALVLASAVAAFGLAGRAHDLRQAEDWSNARAVPTVALAHLTRGDATETVTLPGSIQAYNRAAIYARISGYLKSWSQDIGAHVGAGTVLADIDTPDLDQQLDQAQADLVSAKANERLAAITADRWRTLVAAQAVSRQTADEKDGDEEVKKAAVDASQANVRRLEAMENFKKVTAPFDGVVTARNTDIGALINAGAGGQQLFEVSDLHRVRIYVRVPQALAADLAPGQKATLDLPQYPGKNFEATLVTTSRSVSENSRTMLVELQTDNPDGKLWPGTYCDVHFEIPGNPSLVRVPATALVAADQGMQVAVIGLDGKTALKPVRLGRDLGDTVEVLDGLTLTDNVIDNPPETLQAGEEVRLAAGAEAPKLAERAGAPKLAERDDKHEVD